MRALNTVRYWLSVSVAMAGIISPLVRAEHVHPSGIEGRTRALVHSHEIQVETSDGSRMYAGHGNHGLAIFVTSLYESVLRSLPAPVDQSLFLQDELDATESGLGLHGVVHAAAPMACASPPSVPCPGRSPPRL